MRRDRIGQQWAEKRTFYRFFRIIQTWSALDWIWPHFCIISCLGIRKRVRLSGEMDWANTQKTLAQLLPSSCKILNLSHRKTSGTCQGLGHYISQRQNTPVETVRERCCRRGPMPKQPPPNKKNPNQKQAVLSSLRTVKRAENGFQTALCVEQDKHCIQNQKQQHGLSSKENCFQTNFEGTATSCLMSNGLNQIKSASHTIFYDYNA